MLTITPPFCHPLDLSAVRQHVKQDITDDDDMLSIYLGSAVDYAQKLCTKQFVSARFKLTLPGFPDGVVKIKHGPLVGVESIDYYDAANQLQVLTAAAYHCDASREIAIVESMPGQCWPDTACRRDAVAITFIAGYMAGAQFDATANTVTVNTWRTMAPGEIIRLSNSGGHLPAGLAEKTDYYIRSVVSPGCYTLSLSDGGAAIDLSNAGTGLHFIGQPGIIFGGGELPGNIKAWLLLRINTAFEHRGENVNVRNGEIKPLPYVDRLLDNDRVWL